MQKVTTAEKTAPKNIKELARACEKVAEEVKRRSFKSTNITWDWLMRYLVELQDENDELKQRLK